MHTRDLKSLNNTIASVTKPIDDRRQALQEGYINSLTAKARQVISESENERGEKEDMDDIIKRLAAKALKRAKKKAGKPSTDDDYAGANPKAAKTDPDMKNAGAVAEAYPTTYEPKPMPKPKKPKYAPLPKPKPTLHEKAAPGYEDWASDPKVKASFKKQYGNRWKQVMYGHSWNMKKMDEAAELAEGSYVHSKGELKRAIKGSKKEIGKAYKKGDKKGMKFWMQNKKDAESQMNEEAELAEGVSAKRMRIIRKYLLSGKPVKGAVKDFMDRSIKKKLYKNKEKFGGETSAVLGRAALKHSAMKAKGLAEAEQLDEGKGGRSGFTNLMKRQVSRVRRAGGSKDLQREIGNYTEREASSGESKMSYPARRAFSDADIEARIKARDAKKAKGLAEAEQLDEAGYKKLMRLKKAAYEKKNPKMARAAAEQEAKVAARMAMKGGASAEAVKAGGSRIGKSGKYTQKAASLASNRDKGLRAFRNLVVDRGISRDTGVGPVKAMANRLQGEKPKMTPAQVAKKREAQAAMRDFRNRARSGDFGQNNQEGMRPRYNYLKRTGKLKTK